MAPLRECLLASTVVWPDRMSQAVAWRGATRPPTPDLGAGPIGMGPRGTKLECLSVTRPSPRVRSWAAPATRPEATSTLHHFKSSKCPRFGNKRPHSITADYSFVIVLHHGREYGAKSAPKRPVFGFLSATLLLG